MFLVTNFTDHHFLFTNFYLTRPLLASVGDYGSEVASVTDNGFLSPSKQSRLGIKIVNITNGTTAVVASGFQRPLFSFHANSIDGSVTESIALTLWQAILRKSRFQVNK